MTAEALFDPAWYRIARLRPRLRSHVQLHRHHYRGQLWYVLQDGSSGRFHRFTPTAYRFIGLMDGVRSVDQIWQQLTEELGDDAPTQRETMQLLYQLHAADVLQMDIPPDTDELLRRYDRERRTRWKQSLKSPLAIRIPLFDPEDFLGALSPLARPLFGWPGAVLWLGVMAIALVLAGMHWPELTDNVRERVLTPQNLVLIWLAFPVVKALHELGHAFAVKVWGGEVHQIGIMLIVFAPVPYVDASFATAFRERHRRMVVGAAGMLVELFVAAIAMILWVLVEPGLLRTLAYNVMFIAGVSTLVFNGNPLLRFDAYYILADFLEIPNLASRANQYVFYLIERYVFGVTDSRSPVSARGERGWFLFFAVASFVYRMFVYAAIVLFVASQFFVVGVLLAVWALFTTFLTPLGKGVKYLLTSPRLRRTRRRALAITAGFVLVLAGLTLLLPVPLATVAEGVAWVPDNAVVRPGADGVVSALVAEPGSPVRAGQVLLTLDDPLLAVRAKVLTHELAAQQARYTLFRQTDRVQAEIVREEIANVEARLLRVRQQLDALEVKSQVDGVFVIPDHADLPGRFVRQGEQLGFVVPPGSVTVRAVVSQDAVDRVRSLSRHVQIRPVEDLDVVIPAELLREVPAAVEQLPTAALGSEGGGAVAIDPRDDSGRKPFGKVFEFDLVPGAPALFRHIGTRVYVRFDHGTEPLAYRWYRGLRQVLLRQLDV